MRMMPFIGFVVFLVLLGGLLLGKHGGQQAEAKTFPPLTLNSMDGKRQWDASKLQGRITVLNVFASWCVPCAAEMPELASFKKQFPQVALEGIAWNDDPKTLHAWLKKNGNPFTTIWLDPKGEAAIALGLKGVPETIVVDAEGKIRHRVVGPLTPALRMETFDPLIESLLKENLDAQ